jgi:hypothetical protein
MGGWGEHVVSLPFAWSPAISRAQLDWTVTEAQQVHKGQHIATISLKVLSEHYVSSDSDSEEEETLHWTPKQKHSTLITKTLSIIAPRSGKIHLFDIDELNDGIESVARIEYCLHPADFNGVCIQCGADLILEREINPEIACAQRVGGEHGLNLSLETMNQLRRENTELLEKQRKLLLVLDLDHTVLHATMDPRARCFFPEELPKDQDFQAALPPLEHSLFRFLGEKRSGISFDWHALKLRYHHAFLVLTR